MDEDEWADFNLWCKQIKSIQRIGGLLDELDEILAVDYTKKEVKK